MELFRDIKRNARRSLHAVMRTPVFYIAQPGDDGVLVHVRLHTKFPTVGSFNNGPNGFASMQELAPRILFMLDELAEKTLVLRRTAIISVQIGEAYRLDNAAAVDDISVFWNVIEMKASETSGLPVPGVDDV